MRKVPFLFLFLLLFTACTSAAPILEPVEPTRTALPTATESSTATATAIVAATAEPTATVQPSPTTHPTSPADAFAFEQNRRLGRGVNLGNALEAPVEGEWGMTLEEDFFKVIKDGGFDSIRVPIRWNAHAQEKSPYTIDPAFFERVDWVVEQAAKHDLAVILNIHHYEEIMEAPTGHKERFLSIWDQIAHHYQEAPDSVYFELLNEPNGTISATHAWNQLSTEAVQIIRETNPRRTIIIGPGDWNNISRLYDLQLPADDRNIIVTFHYYQPFAFTHQGAEWVENSEPWMGTEWIGSKTDRFIITRDLDLAKKWSEQNARPIFMGEFGAYSKADMESRHRWTDFMARSAEERGFSWAYWEFGAGFGVYDREQKAWVEPIYSALIP